LRITSISILLATLLTVAPARALDLDWHGQLRAETNWLWGYSNAGLFTGTNQGYSVYSTGDSPAAFQNLFFALSPRVIVNDNVSIKSDIWLGTPDRGMFGGDQLAFRYFGTSRTGNATVLANTFYAEMATDFGTITVGRAPLNWGLGVIWNYDRERFYRLPSTGDTIQLTTKLGAFRFSPSVVKYNAGSNYGGSATYSTSGALATTVSGSSSVSDYAAALSYSNDDDQMDIGLLFLRRLAAQNSANINPYNGVPNSPFAYNVWDFYAKKKAGIFTIAAEVPLASGTVAGQDYATVAAAAKVEAQINDKWKVILHFGTADGQGDLPSGQGTSKLTAFSFHPDYRPSFILFNYNLRNLSDINASPYDSPVTNTRFVSLAFNHVSGKWSQELLGLYAVAAQTANGEAGGRFFNEWTHQFENSVAGAGQEKGKGFEVDYLLGYEWDEAMRLGLNLGLLFPGKFYEFNNTTTPNPSKTIFASSVNVSVSF
jgi:hypothetical protein